MWPGGGLNESHLPRTVKRQDVPHGAQTVRVFVVSTATSRDVGGMIVAMRVESLLCTEQSQKLSRKAVCFGRRVVDLQVHQLQLLLLGSSLRRDGWFLLVAGFLCALLRFFLLVIFWI